MADSDHINRPIQVFLDTRRLIQTQPVRTRGPNKDFFKDNNEGFARHKKRIRKKISDASESLKSQDSPIGFVLVQMREDGLGKSYRPLRALFTARNSLALVGGAGMGEMYFQATPEALDNLNALIEARAEIQPKIVENRKTGEMEEQVSPYRSELGAIGDVRIPEPSDRLSFSARDAVSWLEGRNAIGGYIVELFRPDPGVTPQAVESIVRRFEDRLRSLGGVVAAPFGSRDWSRERSPLALSIDLRTAGGTVLLPPMSDADDEDYIELQSTLDFSSPAERNVGRHQALLDLLSNEPLVRRIEPPFRIEATPSRSVPAATAAALPIPARDHSYPTVGVIDGGIAQIDTPDPWRAGGGDFLPEADKNFEHGSFIAGLLTGAGALNPELSDRFEPVPCRFYDIDMLPSWVDSELLPDAG